MSEVIFWTAVGAIVYAYGGYSLVTMLLALLVRNPVKRADITPSVTLLITAYNEERDIAQKLEGRWRSTIRASCSRSSWRRTARRSHRRNRAQFRGARREAGARRGTPGQDRHAERGGQAGARRNHRVLRCHHHLRLAGAAQARAQLRRPAHRSGQRSLRISQSFRRAHRSRHRAVLEVRERHQVHADAHPDDHRVLRVHLLGAPFGLRAAAARHHQRPVPAA